MTDHDHDEADLVLMQFVDLMRDLGISASEAAKIAIERIPELYPVASEPETTH